MPRVLYIAYFYPPLANSGTQRPLKLANYLPEFGWDPLVLTVADPPDTTIDPKLLREVRPDLRVTRVPMLSTIIGGAVDAVSPMLARRGAGAGVDWRLRHHFCRPDAYALWRPTAIRAARRLFRDPGFDAVWATGFPWTSLLIGRDVARETKRPFIADFRDPWTGEDLWELPTDAGSSRRQRQLERSVLSQAAAVVGIAGTVTDELKTLAPSVEGKEFATISNGFDREDFKRAETSTIPKRARLRVCYTGVWKEGYGLEILYDAIRTLDAASTITPADLEVVAAGFTPGYAIHLGVDRYVTELGPVTHSAALGLMLSADLLFLPVGSGKRQHMHLPGKLYEYAASERPILAVAAAQSEVSAFIDAVGGGIVVPPDDPAHVARVLEALLTNRPPLFPPLRRDRLDLHERKFLARKLADLLYKVTGSPARG